MQQSETNDIPQLPATPRPSALKILTAHVLNQSASKWTIDYLHLADGNCCPFCQASLVGDGRLRRWYLGQRIKCACGRFFTSLTGTVLHGSTLEPSEFFLLYALLELQLPAEKIAGIVPINRETVNRWRKRLDLLESTSVPEPTGV